MSIRQIIKRLLCTHDWRVAGIAFDGEMTCVCAKCAKTKRIPL